MYEILFFALGEHKDVKGRGEKGREKTERLAEGWSLEGQRKGNGLILRSKGLSTAMKENMRKFLPGG